jgi:hypothetical protein
VRKLVVVVQRYLFGKSRRNRLLAGQKYGIKDLIVFNQTLRERSKRNSHGNTIEGSLATHHSRNQSKFNKFIPPLDNNTEIEASGAGYDCQSDADDDQNLQRGTISSARKINESCKSQKSSTHLAHLHRSGCYVIRENYVLWRMTAGQYPLKCGSGAAGGDETIGRAAIVICGEMDPLNMGFHSVPGTCPAAIKPQKKVGTCLSHKTRVPFHAEIATELATVLVELCGLEDVESAERDSCAKLSRGVSLAKGWNKTMKYSTLVLKLAASALRTFSSIWRGRNTGDAGEGKGV